MFYGKIYKFRNPAVCILLCLFLISELMVVPEGAAALSDNQNPDNTVIHQQSSDIVSACTIVSGGKKINTNVEVLILSGTAYKQNPQLVRSTAYIFSFNKESLVNLRLLTFLTAHFSTST